MAVKLNRNICRPINVTSFHYNTKIFLNTTFARMKWHKPA